MPKYRTNKQRIKYFISYMGAAMLIALPVMGLFYFRTVAMVNDQHEQTARNIVQSQQQILDRVFLEIEQIALQIDSDVSFSSYRMEKAGYDTYQGMLQLRRYVAANDFLRDVALLTPGGSILSSVGSFQVNDFIGRYAFPQLQEAPSLLDEYFKEGGNNVRLYPVSSKGLMLVSFAQPLMGLPKTRLLLFVLEKSQMDALFSAAMQGDGSDFAVLDRESGDIIYRYRASANPLEQPGMTVSRMASTRMAVDYVYCYDAYLANEKFSSLNRSFLQIILLTLLAVFIVSQGMSAVNYRPVRRLMELLPAKGLAHPEKLSDVEAYMRNMMARNMEMAQQLQSYSRLTRDYALQQALLGRGDETQLSQMLLVMGVSFPHPYYTVFHFLTTAFQAGEPGSQPVSYRARLLRELEQSASSFGCAEGVEWYDASLVMIVNHHTKQIDTKAIYDTISSQGENAALMTVGCGCTVDQLVLMNHSLYEAMSASELARFRLQPFVDAAHYEQAVQEEISLHLPLEEQLLAAVKQGSNAGIHSLIQQLEQSLLSEQTDIHSLHIQTMALVSLLSALVGKNQVESFQDYVHELMGRNTLATYAQTLEVLCLAVSDALNASKAMREDALLQRITRFIEEHYDDPELTVQKIAQRLSMSASYLTHYMRERMQTTPSKYLESVRMEKAEYLLRQTDSQIKEITRQVGYADASSFVRKFKAEKGVTPMQYREAAVKKAVQ